MWRHDDVCQIVPVEVPGVRGMRSPGVTLQVTTAKPLSNHNCMRTSERDLPIDPQNHEKEYQEVEGGLPCDIGNHNIVCLYTILHALVL